MIWRRETKIVSSQRVEPWGHVTIYSAEVTGWTGCVRNWQGMPQCDITTGSLEDAERQADQVLADLKPAWQKWLAARTAQGIRGVK